MLRIIMKTLFALCILHVQAFADEASSRVEALDFILEPKPYITKTITVIDCNIRVESAENIYCYPSRGLKESIHLDGASMEKKSLIEAAKKCPLENPDKVFCIGEVTGEGRYYLMEHAQLRNAKINWIKK